jgi:hypothetical protein
MKAKSRISPPQFGHSSGHSSPARAISFAHAIREVSCEQGFAVAAQDASVAYPSPPCPPVAASCRLPTLPLADVADREQCDRGPELVIGRKDAVRAMPVLLRWRDEIREPVEELKRREFDDAVGPRPR